MPSAQQTGAARYLKAAARAGTNGIFNDDKMDRACDAQCEAIWGLIRTPAVVPYQISHKLAVLAELMIGGEWSDRREHLLVASIRQDVEAL